jgi:hypothetical protein
MNSFRVLCGRQCPEVMDACGSTQTVSTRPFSSSYRHSSTGARKSMSSKFKEVCRLSLICPEVNCVVLYSSCDIFRACTLFLTVLCFEIINIPPAIPSYHLLASHTPTKASTHRSPYLVFSIPPLSILSPPPQSSVTASCPLTASLRPASPQSTPTLCSPQA